MMAPISLWGRRKEIFHLVSSVMNIDDLICIIVVTDTDDRKYSREFLLSCYDSPITREIPIMLHYTFLNSDTGFIVEVSNNFIMFTIKDDLPISRTTCQKFDLKVKATFTLTPCTLVPKGLQSRQNKPFLCFR